MSPLRVGAAGPGSDGFAKSTRTVVCRDALWQSLEEVATELECTVDYLVNDAIKLYIRQRLTRRPRPAAAAPQPSLPLTPTGQFAAPIPTSTRQPPLPPPLPPPRLPPPRAPMPTPPYLHPPAPPLAVAPVTRVAPVRAWAPASLPPRIVVTYGDQTKPVDGATFVIGRAKSSGLHIKDPNISRQHALIEQQGGAHYIVDAGSTNGTFVNGERIARRALADGDVVTICDHVIRISVAR